MKEIFKNVKEKLVSKYLKNPLKELQNLNLESKQGLEKIDKF